MSDCGSEKTNVPEKTDENTAAVGPSVGMSPYATGGGGVTFERKVAVQYLAHLLLGDGAVEFGEGRRAVSVAFQQAPGYPVDDLVIQAARPEEVEPSLELALGVRRSPNLVLSDESTQKLIREFVRAVINAPANGPESRLGLVVAGPQQHASQLGQLASLASAQMNAPGFFTLVHTPSKFDAGIRGRLDQFEKLVGRALQDPGVASPATALIRLRTWQLLSRLTVLMPRLEPPDETDWSAVENSLIAVARDPSLTGASQLRGRLLALASDYSPRAAQVDRTLLRRDAHAALDPNFRRHQQGWQVLNHLHGGALDSVREEITDSDGVRRLRLDRTDAAAGLVATAAEAAAVIVGGESGVGKSGLALRMFSAGEPSTVQALCINLRQVPKLTVDFEARLGLPLSMLLCELSAPLRILVIDGADAVSEGMEDTFRYLVNAAVVGEVKVIAVSGMDSMQVVHDILDACFGEGLATYPVDSLTDTELDEIVKTFPELEGLNSNPRSRELLRRLVVVALLVRGHLSGVPLTDADAMQEVWSGLVRRQERSDRGHPDARESVLLRLADLSLKGGDRLDVIGRLDGTAVTGLRQDGLLQASVENPFMIGPDFAHDEVRRYAVARLLLAEGYPAASILSAGAPRWALGAARLACQALLQHPDTAATPLRGRFDTQQTSFDALIEAGHGTRWGDVPSEALITLADSSGLIRDAWPKLRTNDNAGLRRLARLVGQRHRDDNGIVNLNVVEPIISLLLEDSEPWKSGEYASNLFREWLQAHVAAGTPAGHPLRILLRESLVRAYAEGDRRLRDQQKAEEAARAARTPEDIERERQIMESHQALFSEIGYGGRRRQQRPEVPRVGRDEVFLELLALLGPDLGDEGEAILLRVARDAPSSLAPVVEELFTGDALAGYQRGLLAQLTLAYYLDDEADGYTGYSSMDDGIRDHLIGRGGFYMPLSAWYRGPFIALFRTDFRRGVAVLNRLLNHAALVGARTLAHLYANSPDPGENDPSSYQETFEITGTPLRYVGDEQVWGWYRGTGVGPYPCISALQALERACDQLVKADAPIGTLVSVLLDGCENLAMVGLIVGLLVRHLEVADEGLDPYFTEPAIWSYEFRRIVDEQSMLAASSEGIEAPERRNWSLRDAAMFTALRATDERADDLRALGETLVDRARSRIEQQRDSATTGYEGRGSEDIEPQLAPVRAWASSLDRNTFQAYETVNGVYVQATPPEEVVQALRHDREDSERTAEDIRLKVRYYLKRDEMRAETIEPHELAADLESARMLLEAPSSFSVHHPWDVPALVAAAALDAYLLRCVDVTDDALAFAVDTVLRVSEGEVSPGPFEFEETCFEQGADRSAAGVLPLLLMPSAAPLRAIIDGADGLATFRRVSAAGLNLAQAVANEVRLHLARGLDHLWATPCAQEGPCHHRVGWQIACETLRDCALGGWNPDFGGCAIVLLDEPLADSLENTPDDSILPSRIDASIRALAPACTATICVSNSARDLLTALLAAQRRSLLNYENKNPDSRGHHSLVSARALLTLAQHGDGNPLYEHINAYADNAALLCNLLQALSAAAEETPDRAAAAREIWSSIIRNVLDLHNNGHTALQDGFYGEMALAALLPNRTPENAYMYREIREEPIVWWEPLELESEVDLWLATAAGKAHCVDQLIAFLRMLTEEDQARVGLPWVSTLVLENPNHIARSSFSVADWLIEKRPATAALGLSTRWQQVVDALVVEGVARLAPYSE